jgi:hypothetical protein
MIHRQPKQRSPATEVRRQGVRRRGILAALWCLALALALTTATGAAAPRRELYELTSKQLTKSRVSLPAFWRYHSGDEAAFAAHGFDDSAWEEVDTRLEEGEVPSNWDGAGWFRLRFRVDPYLEGEALVFGLDQYGAAEIYLDGEELLRLGQVGRTAAGTTGYLQQQPHVFSFSEREEHVLAVRFANHDLAAFTALGRIGGFKVWIGSANVHLTDFSESLRNYSLAKAFLTGVFASFALLHLLFFLFYPKGSENLYFGLLTGTVAAVVFLFLDSFSTTDPRFFLRYDGAMNAGWLLIATLALRFVYSVFHPRLPRAFFVVAVAAAALMIPGWLAPETMQPWIWFLVLTTGAEMSRDVVVALYHHKRGARIVGFGTLTLVLGMSIQLLASLDVLPSSLLTKFVLPFGSMLCLVLAMSVYLSRRFAETSHELLQQLRRVEKLSEQKLEQERRSGEEEVDRARLEAAYASKVAELEEARQLQLSLLPAYLPDLPELEIAADMKTATEVGGDYYDFAVADDGALTIAIGDATGHGMRAGTMVTATKSLFMSLAGAEDTDNLSTTLDRFTRTIKRMNLRQLSMALTLVRYREGRLHLAAAGMPPAFLYRAASASIESLTLEGVPLGSLVGFPYCETELEMKPGDQLLIKESAL